MTARLHHETVAQEGAGPARTLLFTHGIYGSGGNWRSIARRLVERRPDWQIELVDLRQHGRSEAGDPPHTLDACAGDLAALCAELSAAGNPVAAAAGHSFGGKVVLALRARGTVPLAQTWVLDSTPSARPGAWAAGNSVRQVWESLRALPARWPRRDAFIAALEARGHARPLAQWLAMNLEPDGDELRLRLDLDALDQMMIDYYQRDLWPAVLDPALPGEVHVVIAEASPVLSADDRGRLAAEPPAARLRVHVIPGAGHWLHIENPAAVVELFATHLP